MLAPMSGMCRRQQAALRSLARLVAVVAVLASLTLAHGFPCTEDMATAMSTNSGMSTSAAQHSDVPATIATDSSGDLTALSTVPVAMGVFASAYEDALDSTGLGGVLATCLVFILVVVAAVVALRPSRLQGIVRMLRPARVAVKRAVRPRALSLAELCVLRI
jgi:hypothetical protein